FDHQFLIKMRRFTLSKVGVADAIRSFTELPCAFHPSPRSHACNRRVDEAHRRQALQSGIYPTIQRNVRRTYIPGRPRGTMTWSCDRSIPSSPGYVRIVVFPVYVFAGEIANGCAY